MEAGGRGSLLTLGSMQPLRYAMTSGMPDPTASGAPPTQRADAAAMRAVLTATLNSHARPMLWCPMIHRVTPYLKLAVALMSCVMGDGKCGQVWGARSGV